MKSKALEVTTATGAEVCVLTRECVSDVHAKKVSRIQILSIQGTQA